MPNDTPKETTLAALRQPAGGELTPYAAGFGSSQGFALLQRGAQMFASATLVPDDYRGNLPNCAIALNMANRMGCDPLMVMQNLDIIYGRPGWRAKFLIASFNQCGRFSPIRYQWEGKEGEDGWGCRAWANEAATGEKVIGPLITIALAKAEGWYEKKGSKWKTIPELMLMYRAGSWLVNTVAPEISMGLSTGEEIHDTFDAAPGATPGMFKVDTEALRNIDKGTGEIIDQPAAGSTERRETVAGQRPEAEHNPESHTAKTPTVTEAITGLAGILSLPALTQYAEGLPLAVVEDQKFAKAAAKRTKEINAAAPAASEFDKLKGRLERATAIDVLDEDASMISTIESAAEQDKLRDIYTARRGELEAAAR